MGGKRLEKVISISGSSSNLQESIDLRKEDRVVRIDKYRQKSGGKGSVTVNKIKNITVVG